MNFSEAIRRGAMMRPHQAFGDLRKTLRLGFLGIFGKKVYATCAIGAAIEAAQCPEVPGVVGGPDGGSPVGFRGLVNKPGARCTVVCIPNNWRSLFVANATCPVCGRTQALKRTVPHLNDDHKWTREQIADFVESLESSLELLESANEYRNEVQAHAGGKA